MREEIIMTDGKLGFAEDERCSNCISEIQKKYHLENFTTMSTSLLLENLNRLIYDIIMMGDLERAKIEGTCTDMAMKTLALDVLERLKSRNIPYE